jgi:hypothetical protein
MTKSLERQFVMSALEAVMIFQTHFLICVISDVDLAQFLVETRVRNTVDQKFIARLPGSRH